MKKPSEKPVELVLFTVIDRLCAIESGVLVEVLQTTTASPLPFVPDYVDGLINVNGQIIPQIDLATLLYGKNTFYDKDTLYGKDTGQPADNKFSTVLVVDVAGVLLAVKVGQIQEMLSLQTDRISCEKPDNAENSDDQYSVDQDSVCQDNPPTYFLGSFEFQAQQVGVIDTSLFKDVIRYSKTTTGKQGFLGKVEKSDVSEERFVKYLIVEVAGKEYAFDPEEVVEINVLDTIYPQPRAPEQVAGVALIRGKPCLILDLSSLLGEKRRAVITSGAVAMVRTGDIYCGLLISRLRGLEMIMENQIRIDKESEAQTILRQDGFTLTSVVSVKKILDSRVEKLVKPYMPVFKNMDERSMIKQVELLRFEVDGNAYGFDIKKIRRVVSDKVIEPLLSKHGSLMGTIELEGKVVPVINLYEQLGYPADSAVFRECIVVNDGQSNWALAINETDQIIKIDEEMIDQVDDSDCKFISAFSTHEGKLLTILNVKAICQDNYHLPVL